jgi:hypothetical protein
MNHRPAGFQWLKDHFQLSGHQLTHSSYIGNTPSLEVMSAGNIRQVYGPKYAPDEDTPLSHIAFALKYDDLSIDLLHSIFFKIDANEISQWVAQAPAGKSERKIGFLYEWMTGRVIDLQRNTGGNYIDLLDENRYVTGKIIKNSKWRINDNLPGNAEFCPVIRKTSRLKELLAVDIHQKIEQLKESYPQEIFSRAIGYLYTKETRSSYEIEKEKPSADRMEKFIRVLTAAGAEATEEMMAKERLVKLQNAIVDIRFAAHDFRDFQNYVGEMMPRYDELVHYICPPPKFVTSLMNGLKATAERTYGSSRAEIRAAMLPFAFVFIHPFEDGNGRLHRFLIHDILVHDGLVPAGIIIPVSAHMLNNIKDYDSVLEKYSKPLMQRIKFVKDRNGQIVVTNPEEVEGYFRYPDLTEQCIYLLETIHATLREDMPEELMFLQRYDEAKKEMQLIVDMPDRDINLMLVFLHQNKGVFPKRRRDNFPKLTDEEIGKMQQAYRKIYELDLSV